MKRYGALSGLVSAALYLGACSSDDSKIQGSIVVDGTSKRVDLGLESGAAAGEYSTSTRGSIDGVGIAIHNWAPQRTQTGTYALENDSDFEVIVSYENDDLTAVTAGTITIEQLPTVDEPVWSGHIEAGQARFDPSNASTPRLVELTELTFYAELSEDEIELALR